MNNPHPDFDATDLALAARLRAITPPPDLRRKLLALAPEPRRPAWWTLAAPALAFVLIAALAVASLVTAPAASVDSARAHFAGFFNSAFTLDVTGQPLPVLRDWLSARGLATDATIPRGLAALAPKGCRPVTWGGQRGALICFQSPAGVAHLVILPNAAFTTAAPARPRPSIVRHGWNSLAWSAGGYSYLVFLQGDDTALRRLISFAEAFAAPRV